MLKKRLYRAYHRYSGNRHWFVRRFTPAGRMILAALLATGCLGADTSLSAAYEPFVLLSALLAFSLACSLRRHPKVSIQRTLPKTASAGTPFTYRVYVSNRSRRPLRGLAILENLADPRPSLAEFLHSREPEEEKRNVVDRAFGFYRWLWLIRRRTLAKTEEAAVPFIPRGGARSVELPLTPLRRGLLAITSASFARPDPFGLFRSLVNVPTPDKLLILPKRYPVPSLDLLGGMQYQPGGVALASSVGESEEFVSLREYRPGDPLRHVHWKSWAKTGKPIVKEFQDEFFVRHAMILDTFSPLPESELFEEAVSIAASLACTIQLSDSLLDLLFVGADAYCFTAGRGLAQTEKLLEILAAVRTCPDKPFSELARVVIQHAAKMSACLCVFLEWDQDRQDLIQQIRVRGIPLLVLVLTNGEEPRLNPGPMASEPSRFRQVPLARVREVLQTL